jgi:hypothetical protein
MGGLQDSLLIGDNNRGPFGIVTIGETISGASWKTHKLTPIQHGCLCLDSWGHARDWSLGNGSLVEHRLYNQANEAWKRKLCP